MENIKTLRGCGREVQAGLAFLDRLLGRFELADFAVRLWDGTTWNASSNRPPRCTLVLKHPGALRRMFWPPTQLTLGEAYIDDDFDVEGDLEAGFTLADCLTHVKWGFLDKLFLGRRLMHLPSPRPRKAMEKPPRLKVTTPPRRRDTQAIASHYDLSNEFFRSWLDEGMVYSCAYFQTKEDSLAHAQDQKLDYICRKLRLRPNERLLDIGCGWGALILHAVRRFGVEAHGITLSRAQAEVANERIRGAGLSDRCHVEVTDYRDIDEPYGFDKVVSMGMFEHLGEAQLPEYFERVLHLLRPGGVFLNHGIAFSLGQSVPEAPSFIDKYVFPDGEPVSISDCLRIAELTGFEIRDLENLREHYALTLRHWVRRLEEKRVEIRRLTDEATYRTWRLYMAGSAYGFHVGRLNLYQTLLVKSDCGSSRLPLTRADWYT